MTGLGGRRRDLAAALGIIVLFAAQYHLVRDTNFQGADEWLHLSLLSHRIIDFPYANRPLMLLWSLPPAILSPHSLRAFWTLLIPWPDIALALYVLTSFAAIAVAVVIWRSSAPLALRFSAITLAAVLVNPHIFVYDLLVLAPMLLILADWSLSQAPAFNGLRLLLYLAFITPLFGPLSQWTHLQLSVPVFAVLLWTLWRTAGHTLTAPALASDESHVV